MCDTTQGSLCPSPMKIHLSMWIHWPFFQTLNQRSLTPRWPLTPKSVEVTCMTLPNDHYVQVSWKYIKVHGYSVPFFNNWNQRSLTPRWPLTSCLLRSHVWLYPRIIVLKSHGNTSMYVDTVINVAKYHILHTYYVKNEWSHSLLLNTFRRDNKCWRFMNSHSGAYGALLLWLLQIGVAVRPP